MALENKLGITESAQLAREEERISKKKRVFFIFLHMLGDILNDAPNDTVIHHHRRIHETNTIIL